MKTCVLALIGALALNIDAAAQERHPDDTAAPTTTVAGHVFFSDTNSPARMATVLLQPANTVDAYDPEKQGGLPSQAEAVQTMLDGSFVIPHVAPGTYYVVASAPGYISPLASVLRRPGEQTSSGEQIFKRIAKVVPRVTVQANLPAMVNVTLERGAAVSGTVQYDDGSPASGINVQLLVRGKEGWVPASFSPFEHVNHSSITDDQGAYRVSGLPPNEYIVQIDLNLTKWTYTMDGMGGSGVSSSGNRTAISIYSGNSTRTKEARPFALKQGEERHGEDLQIPVNSLHTVRGSLISRHDGHVINGGGISLRHADDKSEAGTVWLEKEDDGVFQFNFVPEGDYILNTSGAADFEYQEIPNPPHSRPPTRTERRTLHVYGAATLPLHIEGDLSGVTISVPDETQQPAPATQ